MLDIRIGAAQRHEALTVVPLVTPGELELPYIPLARALEQDRITITDVGEGTVPELQATVTSGAAVLIRPPVVLRLSIVGSHAAVIMRRSSDSPVRRAFFYRVAAFPFALLAADPGAEPAAGGN